VLGVACRDADDVPLMDFLFSTIEVPKGSDLASLLATSSRAKEDVQTAQASYLASAHANIPGLVNEVRARLRVVVHAWWHHGMCGSVVVAECHTCFHVSAGSTVRIDLNDPCCCVNQAVLGMAGTRGTFGRLQLLAALRSLRRQVEPLRAAVTAASTMLVALPRLRTVVTSQVTLLETGLAAPWDKVADLRGRVAALGATATGLTQGLRRDLELYHNAFYYWSRYDLLLCRVASQSPPHRSLYLESSLSYTVCRASVSVCFLCVVRCLSLCTRLHRCRLPSTCRWCDCRWPPAARTSR
jgi:hypothetical protein